MIISMQSDANFTHTKNILLEVVKFVDGDGLIGKELYSKNEYEIRLYGIDAPEIKNCPKILKDERELQMPAALLMKLGYLSFDYFRSLFSIGDKIKLIQESNNLQDKYGRLLGYVVLESGLVLNEIMIKEGYAKPYNDVFCEMLPLYQEWSLQAKINSKGLYSLVNNF
jgi:micrococcal nuclease